ncbi:MAG: hypothetical protein DWQ04_00230 [Chloroflexi bacterium]|nr:MAG: hypothetical protein DWQ04_00230 [Chloroflexota bacterium]
MSTFPIIAISVILVLVVLLGVVFIVRRQKGEVPETDYRVFFILGITWLPLGIATDNPAFWGMGAIFMIVGLANRDKWAEDTKWSNLTSSKSNVQLLILIGLAVLFTVFLVAFMLVRGS